MRMKMKMKMKMTAPEIYSVPFRTGGHLSAQGAACLCLVVSAHGCLVPAGCLVLLKSEEAEEEEEEEEKKKKGPHCALQVAAHKAPGRAACLYT